MVGLRKQLKYNPQTVEITDIHQQPTKKTDAIAMQHDVDYSVCKDDKKCKHKADRKMVKDFFIDKSKFDNSDYPENSPYFNITNKKIIGKFKDEAAGVPIIEFVGLRSKMYSYMKDDMNGGKTAKGIKKNVIKKDIKHEDYKNVLFNNKQIHHKMKTIRSKKHQLGSFELNKISLSCFDDKRFIHQNGITSYAYGHHKI